MTEQAQTRRAFILRIAPGNIDRMPDALATDEISIGWPKAIDLLDESLTWEEFRQIVHEAYYKATDQNYRRSGMAAGHLWRFLRDMEIGSLVVVPYQDSFYVAEVISPPGYERSKVEQGTAYRRKVNWENDKQPIPRKDARTALQSRMKVQGTTADASDLVADIEDAVETAKSGTSTSFTSDLRTKLIASTLAEIRTGRMDPYGFEHLIASVMEGLGAQSVRIVRRQVDKGADIVAKFLVANAFEFVVAIQAKFYWDEHRLVGEGPIEQVLAGMEAENAHLGMVITCGKFSERAEQRAAALVDEQNAQIVLIDGQNFAEWIVDLGLLSKLRTTSKKEPASILSDE